MEYLYSSVLGVGLHSVCVCMSGPVLGSVLVLHRVLGVDDTLFSDEDMVDEQQDDARCMDTPIKGLHIDGGTAH